jgi:antitoxin HigA-1
MNPDAQPTPHIPLPHPGEVLRSEFPEPVGLPVYAVAKAIGVSRSGINEMGYAIP